MNPIDTYRDAFLKLVADGMTHREALQCFDPDEWKAAMLAEIDSGEAARVFNPETCMYETASGQPSLLCLQAKANLEEGQEPCEQCLELWAAGWTSEVPNPQYGPCQSMSLYWRRPPRRKGKPGRRYLSTNQAWTALQRESPKKPTA